MTEKSEKKHPRTAGFTTLNGERYYRIPGYDRMDPFFMSIPSDTDLWMFVSSRGGLTAGRIDADRSLFPYETVDKLHDAHHHSGPVTLVRTDRSRPWQPLSGRQQQGGAIERIVGISPMSAFRSLQHRPPGV